MARKVPEPLQMFRGTTAQHSAYTGPSGELTVDITKNTVCVHDGNTAGGHPLAHANTTISATNGVTISSGGTLGADTTVSGVAASTSVVGVVRLSDATNSSSSVLAATPKAVSDALAAAKAYTDANVGTTYTGVAPITVSGNSISVADASLTTKGVVQLSNSTSSTSTTTAATPSAVKAAYDLAQQAISSGGTSYTGTTPIQVSGSTISVLTATTSRAGVVQLTNSTSSTSTTTAATPSSVKSAYDLANTANNVASNAASAAASASMVPSSSGTTLVGRTYSGWKNGDTGAAATSTSKGLYYRDVTAPGNGWICVTTTGAARLDNRTNYMSVANPQSWIALSPTVAEGVAAHPETKTDQWMPLSVAGGTIYITQDAIQGRGCATYMPVRSGDTVRVWVEIYPYYHGGDWSTTNFDGSAVRFIPAVS